MDGLYDSTTEGINATLITVSTLGDHNVTIRCNDTMDNQQIVVVIDTKPLCSPDWEYTYQVSPGPFEC